MVPGRISKLKSYLDAKYYSRGIRWLLLTEAGESVYCDKCGNIANGTIQISNSVGNFNIPLCKRHGIELFPTLEYAPFFIKYIRPNRERSHKSPCASPDTRIFT